MKNKHFGLDDMSTDNYRYYQRDPSKTFHPEKNYQLMQETIKEYEEMRYGTSPELVEKSGEVADILAGFAKFKLDRGQSGDVEKYLGKENLYRIYGDKLASKMKVMDSIKKLNQKKGNTKFEDYYLT